MKTTQTFIGKSPLDQGIKIALAIFIILVSVGCQNQNRVRENQLSQKTVDSVPEEIMSQIKALQENQQAIIDSVESVKTDQLTIATKIAGNQRQLAKQVTETAESIHQEQTDLKTTFQNANAQLVKQVQDLSDQQQGLALTTETIEANGQALRTNQDQLLGQLTALKGGYQYWQGQLNLMQEKMAALDTGILAMQTGLSQFENALTESLVSQNDKRQGADQGLQQQLSALKRMLAETRASQKSLLTLLRNDKQTVNTQHKTHRDVSKSQQQQDDQVSVSLRNEIDANVEPGIDAVKGP